MEQATFAALLTSHGQRALEEATSLCPSEKTYLQCQQKLAKKFDNALAHAALETAILREKAKNKFTQAEKMYFLREPLEQASGEIIASYRAQRLAKYADVADLCCGIGGDTLALAQKSAVLAVDNNPLHLAMARENARVHGLENHIQFVNNDALSVDLQTCQAVFADPDRRSQGKRHINVEDYSPPLSAIVDHYQNCDCLAVKLAPAVDLADLSRWHCEQEFIAVAGELKECLLWFHAGRTSTRRATLLPQGLTLTDNDQANNDIGDLESYVYDPNPAVTRADLLGQLAFLLEGHVFGHGLGYVTSTKLHETPWAAAFAVDEIMPLHVKHLRQWLRHRNVGRVEIRKRGSSWDVNNLQRQLKLNGDEFQVMFLIREGRQEQVILARPCPQ